jgi:toxin CptA
MHEIELKSSRLMGVLLAGMLVLALVAVYLAALPGSLRLALGFSAIGLSAWSWRRRSGATTLRIATDGHLQCLDDDAEWRDAEVQGDSFVSTVLIVLRYRMPGGRLDTLILLPDSASADDLRRLRVSLRWTRRTRSDTASPGAD